GGLIDLGAGDQESSAAIQYGGKLDEDVDYRVYAKDFYSRALDVANGASAHDGWSKPQGGFRLDWSPGADKLTMSGDIYGGAEAQPGVPNQLISGGNLTAHWEHPLDGSAPLQLLAYYDYTRRWTDAGGSFTLNTYNLEIQHGFNLGSWNNIVWGVGDRIDQYRITDAVSSSASLLWRPPARTLNLANIFAEDHIPLSDSVQLTVGLKLENDPYSGISPMPSGRLSWKVDDNNLIWGAVSRAVRSPTPFDTDVVEKLGGIAFLTGNPDFLPEQVTAYEAGYRGQFSSLVSFSVSLFENVYDDLKSIEPTIPTILPLYWGNGIEGNTYGLEAWGSYQAADWWLLSAGFNLQREDLKFAPGASGLVGVSQAGDDPRHQVSLRSSMNLSDDLVLDADLRDIGALPDPKVPEYVELNLNLGWRISDTLELSLSGFNLLHARHLEYVTAAAAEVKRNFFVETKWRF
ncbi:MAG TPA: TonB-dependent receptor, partial [Rhizomicrobium sp.]|nr:TonB-dependent receptor [Rhizomicrobium sp.]